jgi:nitrate reductase gamma subunit
MNQDKKRLPTREVITAFAGGMAEWLFAAVPLLVLTIVLVHRKHSEYVLDSVEWSFGASVLAGQALVRFVSGLVKARHLSVDRVLFGVSAILVFVVVPANIVLALVLIDHEDLIQKLLNNPICQGKEPLAAQHLSNLMVTGQVGLFAIASILFIIAAAFGHLWSKRAN